MAELRDYQQRAVDLLHSQPSAAMWYAPGAGKTLTTLTALQDPAYLPALVVAPPRVAEETWPAEVEKWGFGYNIEFAGGSPANRKKVLAGKADIVTLGRDVLKYALDSHRYKTLVLDEASGFKSHVTRRFKTAKKLVNPLTVGYEHVWELTGTPAPNGYMGIWSQLYLLDHGERLYKTITQYRNRFFRAKHPLPNGIIPGYDILPGSEDAIKSLIQDIVISATDANIDLPEFLVNRVDLEMPSKAKKLYRDMEKTFVANLELLGGEMHTASTAAVLSGKLSQISSGALYLDDDNSQWDAIHDVKLQALQEIIADNGEYPVLVFTRYRHEMERIKNLFGKDCHTPAEKGWLARWNAGELPILVSHPASIGHGLNLQDGGHTIIWTTPGWDLELWEQANKRLHRSGQRFPVTSHVLCASGIDKMCLERLESKQSVETALLDYMEKVHQRA